MVKLGLVRRVLIWVLRAEIKVEVTEVDFGIPVPEIGNERPSLFIL